MREVGQAERHWEMVQAAGLSEDDTEGWGAERQVGQAKGTQDR